MRSESHHDGFGLFAFRQQDGRDVGVGGAITLGAFDTGDVEGGRERVGFRGAGGEDGGAGDARSRPARSRIEYVSQLSSVIFQMLVRGSGGSQRPIAQPYPRQPPVFPRMPDRHLPTEFLSIGAPSSVHAAGASMQQNPRNAPLF